MKNDAEEILRFNKYIEQDKMEQTLDMLLTIDSILCSNTIITDYIKNTEYNPFKFKDKNIIKFFKNFDFQIRILNAKINKDFSVDDKFKFYRLDYKHKENTDKGMDTYASIVLKLESYYKDLIESFRNYRIKENEKKDTYEKVKTFLKILSISAGIVFAISKTIKIYL